MPISIHARSFEGVLLFDRYVRSLRDIERAQNFIKVFYTLKINLDSEIIGFDEVDLASKLKGKLLHIRELDLSHLKHLPKEIKLLKNIELLIISENCTISRELETFLSNVEIRLK